MATVVPSGIKLDKVGNQLVLDYVNENLEKVHLGAEYLRVYSPSAEVRGHGKEQALLQAGKKHVCLLDVSITGNYALKLVFDDGHDSGLYTWAYLHEMSLNQSVLWQDYLNQLHQAGMSRDPDESIIKLIK